jgi:hypothetical protein
VFGDRAATWEVHPRWEPGHPMYHEASNQFVVVDDLNVRVPIGLKEEFEEDGTDALTKYMCQPPLTEGGFFENPQAIVEAGNPDLPPLVTEPFEREEMVGAGVRRRYVGHKIQQLPPKRRGSRILRPRRPGADERRLHVRGLSHDRRDEVRGRLQRQEITIQKVVVDFIIRWKPKRGKPVDLLNCADIIKQVCKYYGVRRCTFDRWNSAQVIRTSSSSGWTPRI